MDRDRREGENIGLDNVLHSIPSYKKRWEILTSCVSYFPAVFIQTLFLNFTPILNSRFLIFPKFSIIVHIFLVDLKNVKNI